MPDPIVKLTKEMLHDPATINLERKSGPAVGITQAVYPVPQELKSALLLALLQRDVMHEALVFTRTKHRANRLWEFLEKHGIPVARIHGNRSQVQRTDALAGFKAGKYRVLVATDIAARGIDVEALGHVVNFDVPAAPEDYIHRVGRTARAELTGEAFTFFAPDEAEDLAAIERAVKKPLVRVTLPDFDYTARPATRLEIPIGERIAKIKAQRAVERAAAKAKAERRAGGGTVGGRGAGQPSSHRSPDQSHSRPARPAPAPTAQQAAEDASSPYRDGGAGRRRRSGGRGRGPR
jgi:ATP-dependent RNA helicase RhlE